MVKKGDWIFTCSMRPQIFDSFIDENRDKDNFTTLCGSHHSIENCGLHIVSKEYADFFLKNEFDKYYDIFNFDFKDFSVLEKVGYGHFIRKKDNITIHYFGSDNRIKTNNHYKQHWFKRRFYKRILEFQDFNIDLPIKYDPFFIYKKYIQFVCKKHNIKYEGY